MDTYKGEPLSLCTPMGFYSSVVPAAALNSPIVADKCFKIPGHPTQRTWTMDMEYDRYATHILTGMCSVFLSVFLSAIISMRKAMACNPHSTVVG